MSEYQYYEFIAKDRALTDQQMAALRRQSTRATITRHGFVNEYSFGNLKGSPVDWMRRYFDAHLYAANWGTRTLMFRLASKSLNAAELKRYCGGHAARASTSSGGVVLTFHSEPEEEGEVTFRSRDVCDVVAGHVVTLVIEKRWTWHDHAYASGRIGDPRIAVEKLGLAPLPLEGGELRDLRSAYEPYRNPDPYAPLWRKLTARPRAWFEMDPIAWGAFPDLDIDENPTCDAAALAEAGDRAGARELLMEVLATDLRCIDAHAHLGNLEFDRSPRRAIIHYEIGIRIGELSLPSHFDGVLAWGRIYNRPFLRCLHGYGLCLWRLGRLEEAQQVFERILSLNPNDNQGVRSCWYDVRQGRTWEEMQAHEDAVRVEVS
jgi:tetratricopeptide (TPR) repeat protein